MNLTPSELASMGIFIPMSIMGAAKKPIPDWMIVAATLYAVVEGARLVNKAFSPSPTVSLQESATVDDGQMSLSYRVRERQRYPSL